jgi:hypothetical protein
MRELSKAAFRFSLAMSLHGVQQVLHALAPQRASFPFREVVKSLDAVSGAMEAELHGGLQVGKRLGDAAQQGMVDFFAAGLAAVPLTGLPAATGLESTLQEALRRITPYVVAGLTVASDPREARRAVAESRNKVALDRVVREVEDGRRPCVDVPLPTLVAEAYRRPPGEVLTALVALGQLYARLRLSAPGGAQSLGGWETGLPRSSYFFFQVGMATELATFLCRDLEDWSPESQVGRIVERQVASFIGAARDGGERLAAEALGRVLCQRDRWANMRLATELLRDIDARLADALWHGAGSEDYLSAENFAPDFDDPWPGLRRCDTAAPDARSAERMMAGFVFALVVVNAASPEVVSRFLGDPARRRRDGVWAGMVAALGALLSTAGDAWFLPRWREVASAAGAGVAERWLGTAADQAVARGGEPPGGRLDAFVTGVPAGAPPD